MGKFCSDAILDAPLDALAGFTTYSVCAGQPTSIAEIGTMRVATAAITGANFAKANGDVSGRKTTVTPPADMSLTLGGSADHCVIDNGTSFYVTTSPTQVVTAGGTITPAAHDIEFRDPV